MIPAFPQWEPSALAKEWPMPASPLVQVSGMTLRDYFAAKAISAFLHLTDDATDDPDLAAKKSYRLADAMLKAREVQP